MKLLGHVQTKALVTLVAGVLLVGGTAAALAATNAGQDVVQSLTHAHPMATAAAAHGAQATPDGAQGKGQGTVGKDPANCPGQPEAQNLAVSYHLSTASTGSAVTAICALHQGTFKGTTTSGLSVTSSRVYGYGEIDQLLTYAQYMAGHDKANAGGKLSDSTVSGFLATALHTCGSTALETCLLAHMPGFRSGNGNGNKPTSTPTPRGDKPSVTPTPHGNPPSATPTPHH